MQVSIEKTDVKDLIIVKPEIIRDKRGFFSEGDHHHLQPGGDNQARDPTPHVQAYLPHGYP